MPQRALGPPAPQADVSPVVEIRWRRTADLPQTPFPAPAPIRQEEEDYGFSPSPCLLTPAPLTDFPYPGSGGVPVLPSVSRTASVSTTLRHTGRTLSTRSGATLKDTMVRAGQSSEKAALIYQQQREVAVGLDEMVRAERAKHHKESTAHHKEESAGR